MEFGNVLVVGNSGTGKSTLINAVLGEECAKTGGGTEGVTDKLDIYESNDPKVPLRIIDTIGFVPNIFGRNKAIGAVQKWSKDAAKDGNPDNDINVIWFCVEGTSRKLFPEEIKNFGRATRMWKSVPVIVVITKSYSQLERSENVAMVRDALANEKRFKDMDVQIIPVVAKTFALNEDAFAPPEGIAELIEATNKAMPEGKRAAQKDIADFTLQRKRVMAQGLITACAVSGAAVGALPIPMADAAILMAIETGELNALAAIYGLKKGEKSKKFFDTIVDAGTVSVAAKLVISMLKAIPGVNLPASALNAFIAASFIVAIGEVSAYAFEQVFLGEKSFEDIDWVRALVEEKVTSGIVEKVTPVLEKASRADVPIDVKEMAGDIAKAIFEDGKKGVKE